MSYDSTILSKNPVLYPKVEELTGTVLNDSSTTARHGTINPSTPPYIVTLGIAGPIETDVSPHGASGALGYVETGPGDVLDLADDFTRLGWVKFGGAVSVLIQRNGGALAAHGNWLGTSSSRAVYHVSFGDGPGDEFVLQSDPLPAHGWYMVGDRRVGSSYTAFLNGLIVDSTASLPGGPIVYSNYNDSEFWRFGWEPNLVFTAANLSHGSSRLTLFDYGLSDGDFLEIYEAGRNRLPMFVDINMRTYFIPDLTPPPVYRAFPYSHDFSTPLIERLIRSTDVIETRDGSEERSELADKTRRRYSYDIPIMDAHSRRKLKALLRSTRKIPVVWPISTDETDLADPVVAGDDVVIPVDTTYMDCDIGGRAILSTSETLFEHVEIVDMDPGVSITAKTVQNSWSAGTKLQFAKRAILQPDISLESITDDTQDISLTATIMVEDIIEAPNRITPYTPVLYRGVEVFDPFEFGLNDTSEAADDDSHMVAEVMDTGTGIFRLDTDQEFAKEGIGYTFFLDGRELISRFLGWYEARSGRLNRLWVPTMVRDIGELVAIVSSSIELSESVYETEYDSDPSRSDVALIGLDETVGFRHINSAAPSGDNEILTLSAVVAPYTLANTDFICFALMCRLDVDEVELAWYTNDCLKATIRFREIPKEVV